MEIYEKIGTEFSRSYIVTEEDDKVMFLHPDIIGEEIIKMTNNCPSFYYRNDLHHTVLEFDNELSNNKFIMNDDFEFLKTDRIQEFIGDKYFLVNSKRGYGVIDKDGNIIVSSDKENIPQGWCDLVVLEDVDSEMKYIITRFGLIGTTTDKILTYRALTEDKYRKYRLSYKEESLLAEVYKNHFIIQSDKGRFTLYRYDGEKVRSSSLRDCLYVRTNKIDDNKKERGVKDILLFEKILVKMLKDLPELKDRHEENLIDLANYAYSIGLNLMIDLSDNFGRLPIRIKRVNFIKFMKIVEENKNLVIPITDESIGKINGFVKSLKMK